MTQVLTTDQRQQGFKRLLKILSNKNLRRQEAVRKLIEPVKVKKLDSEGATLEKDRVYKSSEDASELVKQLVNSDRYPIAVDGQYLKRTDISGGREA